MTVNSTTQIATLAEEWFPWIEATGLLRVYGSVITFLGFVGNFLCYISAAHMPQSNSAYLMQHLAVWDSIGAFADGIMTVGSRHFFGWFIGDVNVKQFTFLFIAHVPHESDHVLQLISKFPGCSFDEKTM